MFLWPFIITLLACRRKQRTPSASANPPVSSACRRKQRTPSASANPPVSSAFLHCDTAGRGQPNTVQTRCLPLEDIAIHCHSMLVCVCVASLNLFIFPPPPPPPFFSGHQEEIECSPPPPFFSAHQEDVFLPPFFNRHTKRKPPFLGVQRFRVKAIHNDSRRVLRFGIVVRPTKNCGVGLEFSLGGRLKEHHKGTNKTFTKCGMGLWS